MEKITSLLIAAPVLLALNFAQSISPVELVEKEYISTDHFQCQSVQFLCSPGKIPFTDNNGCGCAIELKSSMLKPDRSDVFCTEQYDPVCGVIETYCLNPPCPL